MSSSVSVTFRQATPADHEGIMTCMMNNEEAIKRRKIRRDATVCLQTCTVVVAVCGTAIIGFIAYVDNPATQYEPAHVYIRRLFVHHHYQSRGIGRGLLNYAFRKARASGAYVKVHAVGQVAAEMFIHKGFQKHNYTGSAGSDKEHWLFQVPVVNAVRQMTVRAASRSPSRRVSLQQ